MSSVRNIQNLALVGFMGTGKSSIGRLVAEHLQFTFVDTDEMIEIRTGKSITDIFSQNGEAVFREFECKVVEELRTQKRLVISTGGGLVLDPNNLASLKMHALIVCLWASPEIIWERVREQTHRPLLQSPNPLQKIRDLLTQREPFYRVADVLINTNCRSPREVAQQVIHQFQFARKSS